MRKTSYAVIHRIYVRLGLAAALVGGLPLISHAGYAQLAPPERFSGTPGDWKFAPSANDVRYGKVAFQPNALRVPVPGSTATMSAGYRFAANAPRYAAAAIFMHPGLRTAIGIASWLGVANLIWDEVNKVWKEQGIQQGDVPSDGSLYRWSGVTALPWNPDPMGACRDAAAYYGTQSPSFRAEADSIRNANTECVVRMYYKSGGASAGTNVLSIEKKASACPVGWYVTPAGCVQNPQPKVLTEPEFVEKLAPKPMPETVPWELPFPTPLPVDDPFINPEPIPNPQHKPKFVPTGDPVPNPRFDPSKPQTLDNQPWVQPGTQINPSPTATEPWRVDVVPVQRFQPGPLPQPPDTTPAPETTDKPKTDEQQSLCEKHPDILACSKPDLDTPEGEIPKANKNITLTEENLFGGGACPADVYFAPHGLQQLKVWDWNQSCGYITSYLKPILLICCTFAAFMILVPGRTE